MFDSSSTVHLPRWASASDHSTASSWVHLLMDSPVRTAMLWVSKPTSVFVALRARLVYFQHIPGSGNPSATNTPGDLASQKGGWMDSWKAWPGTFSFRALLVLCCYPQGSFSHMRPAKQGFCCPLANLPQPMRLKGISTNVIICGDKNTYAEGPIGRGAEAIQCQL